MFNPFVSRYHLLMIQLFIQLRKTPPPSLGLKEKALQKSYKALREGGGKFEPKTSRTDLRYERIKDTYKKD